MTIALIDCDPLVYACGFAVQKTVYDSLVFDDFGNVVSCETLADKKLAPPGSTPRIVYEPIENALHLFKQAIEKICVRTKATEYRAYLTGKGNFRERIATLRPYKGNRDPLHKPIHYQALRDYACGTWGAEIIDDREADDAIATQHASCPYQTIICSVDKDFNQLSGYHYNPKRDVLYLVSEEEALAYFWTSVLSGDSVDNIQGIPGIGPKKAARLLSGCKTELEYYNRCLDQFEVYYRDSELAILALHETCTLLWLKRTRDDVWMPPK